MGIHANVRKFHEGTAAQDSCSSLPQQGYGSFTGPVLVDSVGSFPDGMTTILPSMIMNSGAPK